MTIFLLFLHFNVMRSQNLGLEDKNTEETNVTLPHIYKYQCLYSPLRENNPMTSHSSPRCLCVPPGYIWLNVFALLGWALLVNLPLRVQRKALGNHTLFSISTLFYHYTPPRPVGLLFKLMFMCFYYILSEIKIVIRIHVWNREQ